MSVYRINEADIDVPSTWTDNTLNAFTLPAPNSTGVANIVITRDTLGDKDIEAYADQQLVEAAKKLSGYQLLSRAHTNVDGRPAIETNYVWTTPQRVEIHQRQTCVARGDRVLVFTL